MNNESPLTEAQRIEKSAIEYVIKETGYQVLPEHDHWKKAYISGATAERELMKQQLKQRDLQIADLKKALKELLEFSEKSMHEKNLMRYCDVITMRDQARKLL